MIVFTAILLVTIVYAMIRVSKADNNYDVLKRRYEEVSRLHSEKSAQLDLLKQYGENRNKRHDEFLGKVVDAASTRARTVYYVPRIDEVVVYAELEVIGEL
jgi:hypothetical protein